MQKNKLLIINGTSSSGKTSITKNYLEIAPEVYYHVGLDMITAMINEKHILANIDEIASITHETVKIILKRGSNVILDTVFEDDYSHWVKECLEMFQDYDVRLIKISCDINELRRRELSRKDRRIGLAEYQTSHMNIIENYDFEIDTTELTPFECASKLLEYMVKSETGTGTAIEMLKEKLSSRYKGEHNGNMDGTSSGS